MPLHRMTHGIVLCLLVALTPTPASARCVPVGPVYEIRHSRYVVEAIFEARSGDVATFRVVASWLGEPPSRMEVHIPPRRGLPPGDVGQTYLLFLAGEDDELHYSRCGSSGRLSSAEAALEVMRARGLTRTPR